MAKWTEAQEQAINVRNHNILVSAAAGSGKTAVLVERIIKRIMDPDNPVDVDKILVVTFTNAAAGEMRERILKAIDNELEKNPDNEHLQRQQSYIYNASITTIHSFCLNLVKEHFADIDLDPGVKVADEGEMKLLKSDVVKEVMEEYYAEKTPEFLSFINQFEGRNSDTYIEDMILKAYNKAMGFPWPKEWLDRCEEVYNIETKEELEQSMFIKLINNYANGILTEDVNKCRLMLDICSNGGPEKYINNIIDEKRYIEDILAETSFDRRKTKLNFAFEKLPPCKKTETDEELKSIVIDYRNSIKDDIKNLKSKLYFQTLSETVDEIKKCKGIISMYIELTKTFIDKFREKKRDRNLIDFNDFEQYAIQILLKKDGDNVVPTKAADDIAHDYAEVMIDEYQDSNMIQEAILGSVAGERFGKYNRFMVGDIKQSIYGFRGAKPFIFIDKYNSYPSINSETLSNNVKIILDKNFRSRKNIITTTNFIFEQIMNHSIGGIDYSDEEKLNYGAVYYEDHENDDRLSKASNDNVYDGIFKRMETNDSELWLLNTNGENQLEQIDETDDMPQNAISLEAKFIGLRIKKLVDEKLGLKIFASETGSYRRAKYSDIAILLRSTQNAGETINDQLMSMGIPCYMESKTGYFSTIEIRTIISYLKIVDNPRQDIPLAAVLKSQIGNITDEELAIIRSEGGKDSCLYDNVKSFVDSSENVDIREKLSHFCELLNEFRNKISYTSIYDMLVQILDKTGYYNCVMAMPSGKRRCANIEMLKDKAAVYETGTYKGLFNFVRYIEKMNKSEVDLGEASILSESDDTVRIMTIHKSKGLEFPIVFIANAGKGFNFMDARSKTLLHMDYGMGIDYIDEELRIKSKNVVKTAIAKRIELDVIEEEMRLFYVACTRAKEKLIFTANSIDEKKLESMSGQRMNNNTFLGYGVLAASKNYLDFICQSIGRNKAFSNIYRNILGYEIPYENKTFNKESDIRVEYIDSVRLLEELVKNKYINNQGVNNLVSLDIDNEYNKSIKNILNERLEFVYPYIREVDTHAKMSVSEIKKISYDTENEISKVNTGVNISEGLEYDQEIMKILPKRDKIVPEFIAKKTKLTGALRGTAYHLALELFDYSIEPDCNNIKEMLQKFVDEGRMTAEDVQSIDIMDLVKFAESSIGKRMKNAFLRGELYREAQFVMGLTEGEIDTFKVMAADGLNGEISNYEENGRNNSGDIVLVQGIIDAYFIENDKVVIVDYKTDNVKDINELVRHYNVQLKMYSKAVRQITGKTVGEAVIYSVKLREEICL